MPEVDPELLAVLRLIRAAFGDVEVLEVIDDTPASGQPRHRAGYLTTAHLDWMSPKSRLTACEPPAEAADSPG